MSCAPTAQAGLRHRRTSRGREFFNRLSGGEFNRSVQHQLQSIGRGFEGQGLSRALIEPQSNAIEVGLGEAREIGSSREVLSQQAVGVLVAATLPWTARITEVN